MSSLKTRNQAQSFNFRKSQDRQYICSANRWYLIENMCAFKYDHEIGLSGSGSKNDGSEREFYPGRFCLEEEQGVISFQLEEKDYSEDLLLSHGLVREAAP